MRAARSAARRRGHERLSNTATLASRFDFHGDDLDLVVLAVLHGRGVVPQQAERELAIVLDLRRVAEVGKPVSRFTSRSSEVATNSISILASLLRVLMISFRSPRTS